MINQFIDWANNNQGVVTISLFILTITVGILGYFIRRFILRDLSGKTLIQKQKGGNNSTNIQAGRDVTFINIAKSDKKDFGRIDEIFKSIIKSLGSSESLPDKNHINLSKKIEINFKDKEERRRVQEYFKYAYTKIALIEKRMQEEDSEVQNDLHSHLFRRYNLLKDRGLNNLRILEKLFSQFIIPDKKDNAEYTNLTLAFILFFFDDCTIFEKTESEK